MTQEDKELLLKDLCGRLPYGVIVNYKGLVRPLFSVRPTQHFQITLDNALEGEHNGLVYVSLDIDNADELKPYLRPISSMTDEEFAEYEKANDLDTLDSSETLRENMKAKARVRISKWYHGTDWLNAHHFDYRGLIPKGLAIAVTEENNPYENNKMKKIEIEIPEGKEAKWVDGVLTLVDQKPKDITERIKTFNDACNEL